MAVLTTASFLSYISGRSDAGQRDFSMPPPIPLRPRAATPPPSNKEDDDEATTNVGLIIGIVVAGAIIFLLLIMLIVPFLKKKRVEKSVPVPATVDQFMGRDVVRSFYGHRQGPSDLSVPKFDHQRQTWDPSYYYEESGSKADMEVRGQDVPGMDIIPNSDPERRHIDNPVTRYQNQYSPEVAAMTAPAAAWSSSNDMSSRRLPFQRTSTAPSSSSSSSSVDSDSSVYSQKSASMRQRHVIEDQTAVPPVPVIPKEVQTSYVDGAYRNTRDVAAMLKSRLRRGGAKGASRASRKERPQASEMTEISLASPPERESNARHKPPSLPMVMVSAAPDEAEDEVVITPTAFDNGSPPRTSVEGGGDKTPLSAIGRMFNWK